MTCEICGEPIKPADRKYAGPCATCGIATCPKHTHFYVDGQNAAITNSARPKCADHKGTP